MKKVFFYPMLAVAVALLLFYVSGLRSELQSVQANQKTYQDKIQTLQEVNEGEAKKQNQAFLKRFFNYKDTHERYQGIEKLTTDHGYQSTHPSGKSLPKKNLQIRASTSSIKSYEYKKSRTETWYINEFKLTTRFNKVSDTNQLLIKTKLAFVDGQGWRVDDMEFIGEQRKENK